jgi:hypothetical protein
MKALITPERTAITTSSIARTAKAEPYAYINSSSGVDLKTGRLRTTLSQCRNLCRALANFPEQRMILGRLRPFALRPGT